MQSLYKISSAWFQRREVLGKSEKLSVYYHNLFDFPLTFADLIKWKPSEYLPLGEHNITVTYQNGFYFLSGRRGLVYKRSLRGRISSKKLEIAKKAAKFLSFIPSILMVAVTGSLAMGNSSDGSDIDLLIITRKELLWTSRLLSYLILKIFGFGVRKSGISIEKDKLCLNMWMDESDLIWKKCDRNIYTAHEIAQMVPLANKNRTYEKFLYKNRWILKYWPNVLKIQKHKVGNNSRLYKKNVFSLIEGVLFKIQYEYMKSKITREVATPTRAIFHPQDWGKVVLLRLNKNNGILRS